MAESTLSVSRPEILRRVGDYLGIGPDSSAWSSEDTQRVTDIIAEGTRLFYDPPPVDGQRHRWRFLRPVTTLATVADDGDYDLPDGFGSMESPELTYAAGTMQYRARQVGEAELRRLLQIHESSGAPSWFAVRPKGTAGATGQRYEILFAPIPDAAYTISYRYRLLPDALTSGAPYPFGGAAVSQCILAACIAAAEKAATDQRGAHYAHFLDTLRAAIETDREQAGGVLGYNGDPSSGSLFTTRVRMPGIPTVIINGTEVF